MNQSGLGDDLRNAANRMNQAGISGNHINNVPNNQIRNKTDNMKTGDSLIAFLVGIVASFLTIAVFGCGLVGRIDKWLWFLCSSILFIVELVVARKAGKPIFMKFAWVSLVGLILIIALILKERAVFEWIDLGKQGGIFNE